MKRTTKDEQEKRVLRLVKENDENWALARELEWVPVEEPQFIGWEVWLELSESGRRRRDAEELQHVMNLLRIGRKEFTRHERISRIVKLCRGRYDDALRMFNKIYGTRYNRYGNFYGAWANYVRNYLPYWEENSITAATWAEQPSNIRKYFDKHVEKATTWRDAYDYYRLNRQRFPVYELTLRCVKAYSTHRGIPNGEAQSDYHKMHHYLWRTNLAMTLDRYHDNHEQYYHRRQNQVQRKTWKQGLGTLAKRFDAEVAEEVVEYTEKIISSRATYDTW